MDALGLTPLLRLGMALGEGTGAASAMPLIDMALRVSKPPTLAITSTGSAGSGRWRGAAVSSWLTAVAAAANPPGRSKRFCPKPGGRRSERPGPPGTGGRRPGRQRWR